MWKTRKITMPPTPNSLVERSAGYKIPADYYVMLCICALLTAAALILDTPEQILRGLYKINTSRSVLITDYVALAGVGAALINSAFLLFLNILLLVLVKCNPSGRIIAALFLTIGFSLFGKNFFNTLPIMAGVFLHGRCSRIDPTELAVLAMVSSTMAPIVSEIAFLDESTSFAKIILGLLAGLFAGFIFPTVTQYVKRMHSNFCLYNGGIAGGFIATMFAGFFRSIGIEIIPENYWDTSHTLHLAILIFTIAAALIAYGLFADKPLIDIDKFRKLMNERDPEKPDYFAKYGTTCYINIGVMCILTTGVMLLMNIPINGPVLGGILTVSGFAATGKHVKNTVPILIGSIAATHFNYMEATAPINILAVLFSTGLAPIAGKYGWRWGIATGFLHVLIAVFIGDINGGLNLYNNGFAGSFVVIIIVPTIIYFRRIYVGTRKLWKR
jgi:hypothetical protein